MHVVEDANANVVFAGGGKTPGNSGRFRAMWGTCREKGFAEKTNHTKVKGDMKPPISCPPKRGNPREPYKHREGFLGLNLVGTP